jgi:quinolinate synthase
MKKITLEKTLASLQNLQYEIHLEEELRLRALVAVERMIKIGRKD